MYTATSISSLFVVSLLLCAPVLSQTNCGGGFYNNQGTCTQCQPGYSCDGFTQAACGYGSYSYAGAATCTTCPAGAQCPTEINNGYQICDPGTFSPTTGQSSCTPCPAGQFSDAQGATTCCQCCVNSYNDQTYQTHCQSCPNQTPYSLPGAASTGDCYAANTGPFANMPPSTAPSTCNQPSPSTCPATSGGQGSMRRRRSNAIMCPKFGQVPCPVLNGHAGQMECIDVQRDLESCGGCLSTLVTEDAGVDCTAIPNINSVRCERGECVVSHCRKGFTPALNGTACVPFMAPPITLQNHKRQIYSPSFPKT